jgi:hypothetical protein
VKKKKVVFISFAAAALAAGMATIRRWAQNPSRQVVVFGSGEAARQTCHRHGITFRDATAYLTTERHRHAYEAAIKMAQKWHRHPAIAGALRHDGIALGEMIDYDAMLLLGGLLLDIELYRGIIADEKPDIIFLMPVPEAYAADKAIITNLARQAGIAVQAAPLSSPVSLNGTGPQQGFLPALTHLAGTKLADYTGRLLFLDLWRELRRDSRRFRHYCEPMATPGELREKYGNKKRNIAFCGLRCAESIAESLEKDPDNGCFCLMGPGERRRGRNLLPQVYLEAFATPEIEAIVAERRQACQAVLRRGEVLAHFRRLGRYRDCDFSGILRGKLGAMLDSRLPAMVRGMELVKAMDSCLRLDLFITTSDVNPVFRAMMRVLQRRGRNALVLLHGLDYFTPEASRMFGRFLIPPTADIIATWGDASRDWFISQGAAPETVVTASCSDFDDYPAIRRHSPAAVRRYLGIPRDKKVVLYVLDHGNRGSRYPYIGSTRDEILHNLKDVIEELSAHPELFLVVRPHPGDNHPEEIHRLIRDTGNGRVRYSRLPLIYQLQAMDIMLTHTSSTAVEAMILGKNAVIFNPTGRPEVMAYLQDGAALKVAKKEKLAPAIIEALSPGPLRDGLTARREQFVRRSAGPLDGRATRNIAGLITAAAGEGRRN